MKRLLSLLAVRLGKMCCAYAVLVMILVKVTLYFNNFHLQCGSNLAQFHFEPDLPMYLCGAVGPINHTAFYHWVVWESVGTYFHDHAKTLSFKTIKTKIILKNVDNRFKL